MITFFTLSKMDSIHGSISDSCIGTLVKQKKKS